MGDLASPGVIPGEMAWSKSNRKQTLVIWEETKMGMTGPAEDQNTTTALVTNGIRGVNLGGREDTSPRIWSWGK